jgi:glycine C-acetyltransferase/8-amino-7-oxononanoate synthase
VDFVRAFGNTGTFSNALSPTQAATVKTALDIVRSEEGDGLRAKLMRAVEAIRDGFSSAGIECLGSPSAIVIVPVGDEAVARVAARLLVDRGVLVNVFEFPAVSIGAARFRLQMMAAHDEAVVRDAATVVADAVREAQASLGESRAGG